MQVARLWIDTGVVAGDERRLATDTRRHADAGRADTVLGGADRNIGTARATGAAVIGITARTHAGIPARIQEDRTAAHAFDTGGARGRAGRGAIETAGGVEVVTGGLAKQCPAVVPEAPAALAGQVLPIAGLGALRRVISAEGAGSSVEPVAGDVAGTQDAAGKAEALTGHAAVVDAVAKLVPFAGIIAAGGATGRIETVTRRIAGAEDAAGETQAQGGAGLGMSSGAVTELAAIEDIVTATDATTRCVEAVAGVVARTYSSAVKAEGSAVVAAVGGAVTKLPTIDDIVAAASDTARRVETVTGGVAHQRAASESEVGARDPDDDSAVAELTGLEPFITTADTAGGHIAITGASA